jgi:hypothetical protein
VTTPPTPCPCPRPEGVTDEEVSEVLAQTASRPRPFPVHTFAADRRPFVWPRHGDPFPAQLRDLSEDPPWHVVEWRRCGAEVLYGGWLRCDLRHGHAGDHLGRNATVQWMDNPPGYRSRWLHPPGSEPAWPVPCWTRTAAEAERWRGEGETAATSSPRCICNPGERCSECSTELRGSTLWAALSANLRDMEATPHPPGAGGERDLLRELRAGLITTDEALDLAGHPGPPPARLDQGGSLFAAGRSPTNGEPAALGVIPARLDQGDGEGNWSVGQRVICDGYGDVLEIIEVDRERSRLALRHADGWRSEVPMSYATPTDLPIGARVPRCRSGVPGEWRCVGQRGTPHDCSRLRGPWADTEDDDPPAPSQAAGREGREQRRAEIRERLRARVAERGARDFLAAVERLTAAVDEDDSRAAEAFAAWAAALARWTPPPARPATLWDAAVAWWRSRRASWLASEERRVAEIRERERATAARARAPEVAAVNRALVTGSLGLATGGLPVDGD